MTRTRQNVPREDGFTLIEVLLAIAITAVVMLMVTTTFRVTLEAREMIADLGESTEAGPRILNLIERDLRGLWTFNVKNNAVLRGRNMDIGSFEADRIDFLTTTDAAGFVMDNLNRQLRPSMCEVGYWLKPHPRYRDQIELWRREDPMVDDDLLTGGTFQLVHDRLKSFKITYFKTVGHDAEELHEWDSTQDDELPRRIKIEFTLERKRTSRNLVSGTEIEDFEGAEKTYVRHIVFDHRYQDILKANTAMVPVRPPQPEDPSQGGGGPGAPGGQGEAAGNNGTSSSMAKASANQRNQRGGPGGNQPGGGDKNPGNNPGNRFGPGSNPGNNPGSGRPAGPPPGNLPFDLGSLMRGAGGSPPGLFGGSR
jgi:prepilin-type N-terminal cleavage/methylation domain-containing protein